MSQSAKMWPKVGGILKVKTVIPVQKKNVCCEEDDEVCWSCESSRVPITAISSLTLVFSFSHSTSSLSLSRSSTYNLKGIHLVGRVIISPLILNLVCFFFLSFYSVAPLSLLSTPMMVMVIYIFGVGSLNSIHSASQ